MTIPFPDGFFACPLTLAHDKEDDDDFYDVLTAPQKKESKMGYFWPCHKTLR